MTIIRPNFFLLIIGENTAKRVELVDEIFNKMTFFAEMVGGVTFFRAIYRRPPLITLLFAHETQLDDTAVICAGNVMGGFL